MSQPISDQAKRYFWGDDLHDLSLSKHKKYIVQTLLEKGDIASLRWLFSNVSRQEIQKLLPELRLDPKSSNFWRIYLS